MQQQDSEEEAPETEEAEDSQSEEDDGYICNKENYLILDRQNQNMAPTGAAARRHAAREKAEKEAAQKRHQEIQEAGTTKKARAASKSGATLEEIGRSSIGSTTRSPNPIAMVGKKDLSQLQILKQIQQMTHDLELLKERCGPDGLKGPKGKMTAEAKAVFKRAKAELFKRNKFILGPKQLQQGTKHLLTLMKPEEVLKLVGKLRDLAEAIWVQGHLICTRKGINEHRNYTQGELKKAYDCSFQQGTEHELPSPQNVIDICLRILGDVRDNYGIGSMVWNLDVLGDKEVLDTHVEAIMEQVQNLGERLTALKEAKELEEQAKEKEQEKKQQGKNKKHQKNPKKKGGRGGKKGTKDGKDAEEADENPEPGEVEANAEDGKSGTGDPKNQEASDKNWEADMTMLVRTTDELIPKVAGNWAYPAMIRHYQT